MTLTKEHKKALISDLKECIDKINLQEKLIAQKKDDSILAWHEMELWQLENRKSIIEKALIEGEIEF